MGKATFIALVVLLTSTSVAFAETDVEVGKEAGCNLNPVFVGEETFYEISGQVILNQRIIGLGMRCDEGNILRIEAMPQNSKSVIVRGNWQYAVIVLPADTTDFCIKVWYRPLKAGNMLLRVCQSGKRYFRANIWVRNVPPTHTKLDVNWDGIINGADVELVKHYIANPDQKDVGYHRCDVQHNGQVDEEDLRLVKTYASLAPPVRRNIRLITWGRIK